MLHYVILALLHEGPRTGYDLHKYVHLIMPATPVELHQVYYALEKLHKAGQVDMTVVVQESSPNKKVFHLLEAGRGALQEWLATPEPYELPLDAFYAKVFFGALIPSAALLPVLERRLADVETRLAAMDAVVEQFRAVAVYTEHHRAQAIRLMTILRSVRILVLNRDWLRQSIARLQAMDSGEGASVDALIAELAGLLDGGASGGG